MNNSFLVPDWPVAAHVHSVCTTRAGGQSLPPYDSLNLGDHVGDDPVDVRANRALFQRSISAKPVFLQQVHTTTVAELAGTEADGSVADGCVTAQHNVACTIMVADCLPVLFTNAQGSLVGAAHAGWRGLAAGVLEATIERLNLLARQNNDGLMAWLGPSIGPTAFEVGDEVRVAFVADAEDAAGMFKPHAPGKWLADLQGLARLRLKRMGISSIYGNDGSRQWCTVSNPSRFFSHRRDGVSGRFAACIWLE